MPPKNGKKDKSDGIKEEALKAFWNFLSDRLNALFRKRPRAKKPVLIIIGLGIIIAKFIPISIVEKVWAYITHPGGLVSDKFYISCKEPQISHFEGKRYPSTDDQCGLSGRFSTGDWAQEAENEAKNNFCVSPGDAKAVTYEELHGKAIVHNLNDRKEAESMGEGSYVSYIAFIGKDAGPSDVDKGEPVNCNRGNQGNDDNNDIVIPLVENRNDPKSPVITAEMSPHYRPPSWSQWSLTRDKVTNRPVRVQGQLFFDGTCTSCPTVRWEIHPVYSLDVCKFETLSECRKANPGDWTPLSKEFSSQK